MPEILNLDELYGQQEPIVCAARRPGVRSAAAGGDGATDYLHLTASA